MLLIHRFCQGIRRLALPTTLSIVLLPLAATGEDRKTTSMRDDLVATLTRSGDIESAIWVCQKQISSAPPATLEHARWVGKLTQTLAEQQASQLFDGRTADLTDRFTRRVEEISKPVDDFLSSFPDFEAAPFLKSDRIAATSTLLRTALIVASISPLEEQQTEILLSSISRLQRDAADLERVANQSWTLANAATSGKAIHSDQWERLSRELAIRQVSVALLQCELFPVKSTDYLEAAATAVKTAKDALNKLPDDAPIKGHALELYIEALLRSGDVSEAERELKLLLSNHNIMQSPTLCALAIRIALSKNNVSSATRLSDSYFQQEAPARSIEMDFAKLDVLLRRDDTGRDAANWLIQIENRGGAFARRRAEAIIVKTLKRDSGSNSPKPQAMSPAIVAAQGEDWLRRRDFARAATLLREAATIADGKPALQYATKSAAAALKNSDLLAAAETLREIAIDNSQTDGSIELAIQSSILLSQNSATVSAAKRMHALETTLLEAIQTWPRHEKTESLCGWLNKIFQQSERYKDAAQFSLQWLTQNPLNASAELVRSTWFEYLKRLDPQTTKTELESFAATLLEVSAEGEEATEHLFPLVTLLVDKASDFPIQLPSADPDQLRFITSVYKLRTAGIGSLEFNSASEASLRQSQWRLERDILTGSAFSQPIARQLLRWPGDDAWLVAKAKFWADTSEQSIAELKTFALRPNTADATSDLAMMILSSSRSSAAKQAAAELAEHRAASRKLRSKDWYLAKLDAITWLNQAGENDEAKKRASFILLLHPPSDPKLKEAFERYR
ncbi:hypothetical protein LOC67_23205 [Stieleria sp. JC731]|uniref:hypothetical protein n=1 Tax=Pirellulaceae TaxID=2691357 RepID=UPI001E39A7B7|nr:hypothetical protein [Stieleria sp. JC731]MCC9603468.1 hypothetical protein [Stieleria sp. JC731]